MNNKGITFVSVIMIIILLGIIAFGITSYISEALLFNISSVNSDKALYMAQAGVMSALEGYLDTGFLNPQSNINVLAPSEFYYTAGDSSSLLLIDGSGVKANGRVVNTWPIQNISSTTAITINSIVVEWDFAANLNSMKIGNNYIFKNGSLTSPATINSSNCYNSSVPYIIPANTTYGGTNDQYIQFSTNVPAILTVIVTFNFSDGSSLRKYLVKAGQSTNKEFQIKATGKIQSGPSLQTRKRTLVATYDTGTNKITSWEESPVHIGP